MEIKVRISRVSCSTFASFSSTENGGTIGISNSKIPIEIQNCNFINSTSSLEGGAIYINNSEISLSYNYFYGCTSNCKENGKYGNAMPVSQTQSDFNESSCYMCAKDSTMYSDTCVCSTFCKFITVSCNGTNNFGQEGSGCIGIHDSKPGSYVKFNRVYKCFDRFYIEFERAVVTASFCEFIDATGQISSYSLVECTASFENCVFIDALNKDPFLVGEVHVQFINCTSNENHPDMTHKSLDKSDFQITYSSNQIVCNQVACSNFVSPYMIYLESLFTLLSLQ